MLNISKALWLKKKKKHCLEHGSTIRAGESVIKKCLNEVSQIFRGHDSWVTGSSDSKPSTFRMFFVYGRKKCDDVFGGLLFAASEANDLLIGTYFLTLLIG